MAIRVGINGFGRIGRQVLKAMRERYADEIDVVAFNDLGDLNTMAHLLRYDSNYGVYPGSVDDIINLAADPLTLQNVASARPDATNDFLPAAIRTLASVAGSAQMQEKYLQETGRRLVHLMRDDMTGLQAVLAKIRPA